MDCKRMSIRSVGWVAARYVWKLQGGRPTVSTASRIVASSSRMLVSPSSSSNAVPGALLMERREKSYNFFMNLDDPEVTRRRVEEDLERLADENRKDTTAYLHSLLNLALSYYQRSDFIAARDIGEYTHQKALLHNPASSFIYFTAITCARCTEALANQYEEHIQLRESQAHLSAALSPGPSIVFGAKRTIRKLRTDATRYRGIAQRVYNRPDMAFMRGGDTSSNHWRSSRHGQWHDTRCAWGDESSNNSADEEYVSHMYDAQWRERRKRPEHAEVRHYCKQQCDKVSRVPSGVGRWTVPK